MTSPRRDMVQILQHQTARWHHLHAINRIKAQGSGTVRMCALPPLLHDGSLPVMQLLAKKLRPGGATRARQRRRLC
jgi:hypothetical protein